ncbi:MAG: circularly permuted type 2 ATP-grasp protein, partial [Akkermansiaceae bacterium]|nr:circularly permuted type 2 ATP-grasp protein [Akkermansiaceae bacterium]
MLVAALFDAGLVEVDLLNLAVRGPASWSKIAAPARECDAVHASRYNAVMNLHEYQSKRVFADLFRDLDIHPVDSYPNKLYELLASLSPRPGETPVIAVLTPGIHNSAYFEHSFLAQQMGVELVEGRDLVVSDGYLQMRTTHGLKRVDVIYRRIDDEFIDPLAFRPDSMLGIPGLMQVYREGRLALANAPGTGIADDKVI